VTCRQFQHRAGRILQKKIKFVCLFWSVFMPDPQNSIDCGRLTEEEEEEEQ